MKICACGNLDVKFKGYCRDCVVRLREEFDKLHERYQKLGGEYEEFSGADKQKADRKIKLMQNKIEQYELKLGQHEIVDVIEKHEKLSKTEENRAFAEFRATVESLKQELEIKKVKQDIDLKDLRTRQDYLEGKVAKKTGQRKELEREME